MLKTKNYLILWSFKRNKGYLSNRYKFQSVVIKKFQTIKIKIIRNSINIVSLMKMLYPNPKNPLGIKMILNLN